MKSDNRSKNTLVKKLGIYVKIEVIISWDSEYPYVRL